MKALTAYINWLWRLLMTPLCFILFGTGGLLLSLVWFRMLLCVRTAEKRKQLARYSISVCFRVFLRTIKILRVIDFHIEGAALLGEDRCCLVVANHPTLIDYVLLASVMPYTDCLVKSTLMHNPFVSGVIRAADYLLNSQAESLLPLCRHRLTQGETVLIFPEGTRTTPGDKMVLQRGAANIAVRCQCDLRVVVIHCSEKFLDKTSRWYQVPATKPVFRIMVGERVKIDAFNHQHEPSLAARQLNRHLLCLLSDKTDAMDFRLRECAK